MNIRVLFALVLTLLLAVPGQAARIWQSGFETGDVIAGQTEWGGTQHLANFHLDTTIVRSGTYSGRFNDIGYLQSVAGNNTGQAFARFYLRISGTPDRRCQVFAMLGPDERPLLAVYLKPFGTPLGNERKLELYNTEDQFSIGLSTTQLPIDEWVMVEVYCGTPSGQARLRINGIMEIIEPIGNGWSSSVVDRLQFGPRDGTNGITLWYDDCAWNRRYYPFRTAELFGWPGPGSILNLNPAADAGVNQWVPSNGGAHYAELDDLPGTPDVGSYLSVLSTAYGLEDRWSFQPSPGAATIAAVCYGVRGGVGHKFGATATFRVRDPLGQFKDGANLDWAGATKTAFPILAVEQTFDQTPQPLTNFYIDALTSAGIVTNTTGKEVRWTTVWASVDYIP